MEMSTNSIGVDGDLEASTARKSKPLMSNFLRWLNLARTTPNLDIVNGGGEVGMKTQRHAQPEEQELHTLDDIGPNGKGLGDQ